MPWPLGALKVMQDLDHQQYGSELFQPLFKALRVVEGVQETAAQS